MNLETRMSSLELHDRRKRRYSGYFKPPKFEDINKNITEDLQHKEDIQHEEEIGEHQPENNHNDENIKVRRSTRKRIQTNLYEASNKRRVQIKPKKLDEHNFETIKNYYLDKTIKRLPSTLETIFENPQESPDGLRYWSLRRYRRSFNFSESIKPKRNPWKIRKRSMKVKAINSTTKPVNKRKMAVNLEYVQKYLKEMLDDN